MINQVEVKNIINEDKFKSGITNLRFLVSAHDAEETEILESLIEKNI